MDPIVTIGMLHYRRIKCLRRALVSLVSNTPRGAFILRVVLQGPSPRAERLLHSIRGVAPIELIRFPENLGIGAGKRILCEDLSTPYVFIMDDDMVLTPGWLPGLLRCMAEDPRLGAVSPYYYYYGRRLQSCGGQLVLEDGRLIKRYYVSPPVQSSVVPSDFLAAGLTLIRKQVLKTVKFDDGYFVGYEDLDFWLALRQTPWRLAFVPDSRVHHYPHDSIREYLAYHRGVRRNIAILEASRTRLLTKFGLKDVTVENEFHPNLFDRAVAAYYMVFG